MRGMNRAVLRIDSALDIFFVGLQLYEQFDLKIYYKFHRPTGNSDLLTRT